MTQSLSCQHGKGTCMSRPMQMCQDVGGTDSGIVRQADEQIQGIDLPGTSSLQELGLDSHP